MSNVQKPRYLALGDSYTIGEGIAEADRWPVLLTQALHDQGISLGDPHIVAKTGWSTDELATAIKSHELHPPHALVSLLIGVNNQYRGRDSDNYRQEFLHLLQFAIRMANQRAARVLVVSIPDWGVTPMASKEKRDPQRIASEIDAYNAIARHEAETAGARFVDITNISRACGNDPLMLAEDGLHPSATQYARWLPAIVAAACECLATP